MPVNRRDFLKSAGFIGAGVIAFEVVGTPSAQSQTVPTAQAEDHIEQGTIEDVVKAASLVVRSNATHHLYAAPADQFADDWVFKRGDQVAIDHRETGLAIVPFVESVEGSLTQTKVNRVHIGRIEATIDTPSVERTVSQVRATQPREVTAILVRNVREGQYRCFGMRAVV
jgi:hypothetical protein